MINAGTSDVLWLDDDWTVITEDMSLSAHYENTIVITEGVPEILTLTESELAAEYDVLAKYLTPYVGR
jgi:methionyl aminopeptidase